MKDTALSRKSVEFWREQDREFYRYNQRSLRQFVKYARRYAGDFQEIAYATRQRGDGADGEIDSPALANLVTQATRVFRSNLYFRNPRFVVRPPGGYNRQLFTPLLARIETCLLNDFAEETHLFRQMRRSLLDGILGPYMVTKITYDDDLAVDDDVVLEGRMEADIENAKFVALGVGPRVGDNDYHPGHIEQHEKMVASMERGEVKVPDSAIRYLKKHIQKHREAIPWSRPSETMRNQSVHARRINPLLYGYDVFNVDMENRTWVREDFLMRVEEAQERVKSDDWLAKAVDGIKPIKSHYQRDTAYFPRVPMQYDVATPDALFRCSEYLDLVNNNVVLIAEGGSVPLQIKPYSMSKIQLGGPYVETAFLEHPLHNTGVCMHYITEAHQEKASILSGVNTETVERSLPIQWVNGRAVGTEEIGEIQRQVAAGMVVLKHLRDGEKGEDVIGNIPPVEIPNQNAAMESYHRARVQEQFGGQASFGGGDVSNTATASEVGTQARNLLSDDSMAQVDDHMRLVGVSFTRYSRTFYDLQKVVEIFGPDAALPGGWPARFAHRDIVMDRGISVVPGSSRRNDSAIESKQYQELILTETPLLQAGIVPPDHIVELVRRAEESVGIFGMDYEAMMEHMLQQQAMQAMGGGGMGMGGDGPDSETMGAEARMSESTEPSIASQAQGIANVGGGRTGPGATRSDMKKQRQQREAVNA